MRIITGQAVRGENFFKRPILINKLWRKVDSGSSIIISAPRRVGKTSLMRYIEDNPNEKYYVIYVITESVDSENRYYEEIVKSILCCDFINKKDIVSIKIKNFIENFSKSIDEVGMDSIKLGKNVEINYYEKFIEIMKSIGLEERKLIIMIDEFAQSIQNIHKKHGAASAIHLLQSNRALRQNSDINEKFQFIYTGSISLESIARRMESSKFINDLDIVKVTPLKEKEAKEFVKELLKGVEFSIDHTVEEYMLNKIKWLNPFYIQLALDKIQDIYYEDEPSVIDEKVIDSAISRMIEESNKFSSWYERLNVYKGNEYNFIMEILNIISTSQSKSITSNEIYNFAVKYDMQASYKELINTLKDDGYIDNNHDEKIYTFTSPILRMWWCMKIAN
jgi:hypothetical protein